MKRLRILTLCSLSIALAIFFFKKETPSTISQGDGFVIKKEWLAENKNPATPKQYCRPADQTFLTFPEWFLVFSPDEQAQYFKHTTATTFPFTTHITQIWQSYKIVCDQIRDNFVYNGGYHFMIWVIGSSTTVEYTIKAWYEKIIGRLTDTYEVITDEDIFNATFTQNYVDFIKDRPWYEFNFKKELSALYKTTTIFDTYFIRKIERKYILTSELIVKIVYGKLIGLGTASVYEAALPTTEVLVDSLVANVAPFKILKTYENKSALISLPRYNKFNDAACKLAQQGFTFKEVAGNNSAILITVLAPVDTRIAYKNCQTIFIQSISSQRQMQRIAIAAPVKDLSTLLLQLKNDELIIEHIFDF